MFNINKWAKEGNGYNMPIAHCENLIGFHPKSWAEEFRPYYNYSKDWAKDHCDYTWKTIFGIKPTPRPDDEWHDY